MKTALLVAALALAPFHDRVRAQDQVLEAQIPGLEPPGPHAVEEVRTPNRLADLMLAAVQRRAMESMYRHPVITYASFLATASLAAKMYFELRAKLEILEGKHAEIRQAEQERLRKEGWDIKPIPKK